MLESLLQPEVINLNHRQYEYDIKSLRMKGGWAFITRGALIFFFFLASGTPSADLYYINHTGGSCQHPAAPTCTQTHKVIIWLMIRVPV